MAAWREWPGRTPAATRCPRKLSDEVAPGMSAGEEPAVFSARDRGECRACRGGGGSGRRGLENLCSCPHAERITVVVSVAHDLVWTGLRFGERPKSLTTLLHKSTHLDVFHVGLPRHRRQTNGDPMTIAVVASLEYSFGSTPTGPRDDVDLFRCKDHLTDHKQARLPNRSCQQCRSAPQQPFVQNDRHRRERAPSGRIPHDEGRPVPYGRCRLGRFGFTANAIAQASSRPT